MNTHRPTFTEVRTADSCSSEHKKINYFDATMRGFTLEVRASGGKTYYQRYTDDRGPVLQKRNNSLCEATT